MRPGSVSERRGLALLIWAALAVWPVVVLAAPAEAPPEGFTWKEMKEIRAWILQPDGWYFRLKLPAHPFFDFSAVPFADPYGVDKGLAMHAMIPTGEPADERAASWIANCALKYKVLRGWTRKDVPAGPFTTYGLVCVMLSEDTTGVECICEFVLVANRVTNTVYQCWLVAPTAEWKDVEATGETMLANLRFNPEF